jgi:hypothetical protein
MGSPPTLPLLSPLPMSQTRETYLGRQGSQKQFLPHAQQINDRFALDLLNRRANYNQMPGTENSKYDNRPVLKHASTSGYPPFETSGRDVLHRSHSVASDMSRNYHASSAFRAPPQLSRTSSMKTFTTAISQQDRYPMIGTKSSRSMTPAPSSVYSTSMPLNALGRSNGTNQSQGSLSSHNYAKHQTSKGRLEVFPALPDMLFPTTPSALESHPVVANSKSRRVSLSSQNSTQSSKTPKSPRPLSEHRTQSSTNERKVSTDVHEVIHRENPDKRGLPEGMELSKRQEKLMQLKAEKEQLELEKIAKDMARDKVRERVKRANELEQEREKELVKEEKKMKRRSFLCGLFRQ